MGQCAKRRKKNEKEALPGSIGYKGQKAKYRQMAPICFVQNIRSHLGRASFSQLWQKPFCFQIAKGYFRVHPPAMKYEILSFIDVSGTIVFALSGVFADLQKKLDVFGILVIAFITALGGGTLRDLLIGDTPVVWLRDLRYPLIICLTTVVALLFTNTIRNFSGTLLVFDSLGLGFFTLVGIQKGLAHSFHPLTCIALGTITGCFGGVIRDIALNNIPLIFQKELYATVCIAGGLLYFMLQYLGMNLMVKEMTSLAFIFLIRLLAVRYALRLPVMAYEDKKRE